MDANGYHGAAITSTTAHHYHLQAKSFIFRGGTPKAITSSTQPTPPAPRSGLSYPSFIVVVVIGSGGGGWRRREDTVLRGGGGAAAAGVHGEEVERAGHGDGDGGGGDARPLPLRTLRVHVAGGVDGGGAVRGDGVAGHHPLLPPEPLPPELQAAQMARVHLRLLRCASAAGD